jgi:hypothetical protein
VRNRRSLTALPIREKGTLHSSYQHPWPRRSSLGKDEPCRALSLRWREGSAFIQWARRKCVILSYWPSRDDPRQQSAQVSRLLHRLHVYGLVAKIPRSRRWRVTAFGHRVMGASVRLRQVHFPAFDAEAA